MKTYKIPVTFYIEAVSEEQAEATVLGALTHLEDNCGLLCHAQLDYNVDETHLEIVDFDWEERREEEDK